MKRNLTSYFLLLTFIISCGSSEERDFKNVKEKLLEQKKMGELVKHDAPAPQPRQPVPKPPQNKYTIYLNGESYGPIIAEEVIQWIKERRICPSTYISKNNSEYKPLSYQTEFYDILVEIFPEEMGRDSLVSEKQIKSSSATGANIVEYSDRPSQSQPVIPKSKIVTGPVPPDE
ncbi:MAG: hypothetical protein AB1765_01975 [Candidatus Hydrogenedentota bacterium]